MKPDKPSDTALLVARGVYFMARDAQLGALVPPDAALWSAKFLRAASPRANRLLRWCDKGWFRGLVWFVEKHTIHGILRHYVLRKRWLEAFVRQSLATGCTQVVILGGGFDTLAVRLGHEFPTVTFIEFDHSSTQRVKSRALRNTEAHPNLYLHPLDLNADSVAGTLSE